MISLHLTWNWSADLQREALREVHPDLEALMEEIMPYASDYLFDMVPIVDDDDLKEWGQYSEESLVEKYRKSAERVKKATPKINHDES